MTQSTASEIQHGLGAIQRQDIAERLVQLVSGWRGAERGQALTDLHQQCVSAAGLGGRHLLPTEISLVGGLDALALRRLKPRLYGNVAEHVRFRVSPAGRFDAALVPVGPIGQPCDRWLLVIDEELPIQDQVALYAHALGHSLLNREMQLNGRAPLLDPSAGYSHWDVVAELRRIESAQPLDRRVLEAYPLLTELLRIPEEPERAPAPPGLRERLASWGWRGQAVTAPYTFTQGRIFINQDTIRRGRKLRADALLRYDTPVPAALAHVLRLDEEPRDAEVRLEEYAHDRLGLPFAYLIEEKGTVHEWDWTCGKEAARRRLDRVPDRDALWQRWMGSLGLTDARVKNTLCYPYSLHGGKPPRYYQEAAINHTVVAVLRAQRGLRRRRILLNLATGTGKTPIAFQIVWKLKRSRAIRNVLFLTDRDFLLGQAMDNHFAPFGEARARVLGGMETAHDVIFATYHALAGDSTRPGIYQQYPRDFFDLVIVDECHRGSADEESKWRLILNHFRDAIQIGLTATPLRNDNVQTYDYFGKAVWAYSLHRGIMDGFLAPYRVRRVKLGMVSATPEPQETPPSASDENGTIGAQTADGSTIMCGGNPEEDRPETAGTLLAATEVIAEHLARYLRASDPMAKTIVFCVDQDHAARMCAALIHECADLVGQNDGYVQRIVSDEGSDGKLALGRFGHPDEPTPVIAVTSRLLSTGVDVPTCKNVVLARPIGSIVEFKQIIGRGTRLHPPQKTWFTILDYAGATKHFFDPEFDGDPEAIEEELLQPRPEAANVAEPAKAPQAPEAQSTLYPGNGTGGGSAGPSPHRGRIAEEVAPAPVDGQRESPAHAGILSPGSGQAGAAGQAPVQRASETSTADVALPLASGASAGTPNALPVGHDGGGPASSGAGSRREIRHERRGSSEATSPGKTDAVGMDPAGGEARVPPFGVEPLSDTGRARARPRDGKQIAVIGEDIYEMGPDGKPRRIASYSEYTRKALEGLCETPEALRSRWLRPEQRREIRDILEDEGVDQRELAAALQVPDADPLDLLLHVGFGAPIRTRSERAAQLCRDHAGFVQRFNPSAREILNAVLEKYVAGEAEDVDDLELLKVPPLCDRGTFMELIRPFGGGPEARAALHELASLLYAD